jgi:hypothetical protein
MPLDYTGFILILLSGLIIMALSYTLDRVWAAAFPMRFLYLFLRAPGVILHECAHIAGCILTGARIQQVTLFSREGGSVHYSRPLLPWIGDVIIGTAPLFLLPLVLLLITGIFSTWLGCIFPAFPQSIFSFDAFILLGEGISYTIRENLVTRFNGWFILYLYLTVSIVLSVAPSSQDMKNATVGIFLLTLCAGMIIWADISILNFLLAELMRLLEIGFTLGLVYGSMVLVISSPLLFWYAYRYRS